MRLLIQSLRTHALAAMRPRSQLFLSFRITDTSCSCFPPLVFQPSAIFHVSHFRSARDHGVEIDVTILSSLVKSNSVQLIDVREPNELKESGEIEGAVNIPLGSVENAFLMSDEEFRRKFAVPKPRKSDSNIVFFCRGGVRGMKALRTVGRLGYHGARNLKGGYLAWEMSFKQDS
ncbi:Heat shock protein 67B2 [Fasciola gigantica]|uniref:Heat shock protein 67B2 n=1 Tax=Fasciola gigantica TaxID=46835 RepID=A0A504YCW4_FASGI|nr:Heat shock protein 67B2 [Fasciola gigantica]